MDQHLRFRMEHMGQKNHLLGQPSLGRLPTNSSPMLFRSKCKPTPLSDSTSPKPELPNIETAPDTTAEPTQNSPQVQKQVKQLQFWLKVFSRFCHNGVNED